VDPRVFAGTYEDGAGIEEIVWRVDLGAVVRIRGGDLKRGRPSGRLPIRRHCLEIVAPLSADLVAAFGHDRADPAAGRQRR
jgi:hypothetical protein